MTNTLVLRNSSFMELSNNEIFDIEGGGFLAGVAVFGGVCGVVAGACMLLAPEPTGLTKVGGWATVLAGASCITIGIATWND